MVYLSNLNDSSKFKSQILRYKQGTELDVLCYVHETRVLLLFYMCTFNYVVLVLSFNQMLLFLVNNIIYKHIGSVYFVWNELFCQEKAISIL